MTDPFDDPDFKDFLREYFMNEVESERKKAMSEEKVSQWKAMQAKKEELLSEIKAIESAQSVLAGNMGKLYYVFGNGGKALARGIHFVSADKDTCIAWLKENYPAIQMVNSSQFSSTAKYQGVFDGEDYWLSDGIVDGIINECTPISDTWAEVYAVLERQQKDT